MRNPRSMHQHTRALTALALAIAPLTTRCFTGNLSDAQYNGPPFSADIVSISEPNKPPTRIFMGNGKMRMESTDPTSHGALVFDPVHSTTLLIMDKDRTYIDAGMFTSLVAAGFAPLMHFMRPVTAGDPCTEWNSTVNAFTPFTSRRQSGPPPHFTCRSLGTDNVGGRPAQKWGVTSSTDNKEGTIWIDQRLHIMSKAADDHSQMELRNIHEGPQAVALFEAPAGYRKLSVASMLSALGKDKSAPSTGTPPPTTPADTTKGAAH
jgi:hypothetical protein